MTKIYLFHVEIPIFNSLPNSLLFILKYEIYFTIFFTGCDATKQNEEDSETVEEKGMSGAGHVKTDNGYAEEQSRHPDQHLHSKSSSVMHEESSEESYLQVSKYSFCYENDYLTYPILH